MDNVIEHLKRRSEFLRVANMRSKWVTHGLILQFANILNSSSTNKYQEVNKNFRVGFTCSKKIGNAVARNLAKRRLRAVATTILPIHASPDYDYVLIGRKETLHRPFDLLLQDLRTALEHVV
ncbi:MAG: ribonuclease P protein component [Rhodospirillaceae bacterium]|nr:ribonuclease P protein component [Rhodospirillaceae bacterium]